MATSQDLSKMKLTELRDIVKQLGLRGTSTMRKPELIQTIEAARSGGAAPEGVTFGEVRRGRLPKIEKELIAEHNQSLQQRDDIAEDNSQDSIESFTATTVAQYGHQDETGVKGQSYRASDNDRQKHLEAVERSLAKEFARKRNEHNQPVEGASHIIRINSNAPKANREQEQDAQGDNIRSQFMRNHQSQQAESSRTSDTAKKRVRTQDKYLHSTENILGDLQPKVAQRNEQSTVNHTIGLDDILGALPSRGGEAPSHKSSGNTAQDTRNHNKEQHNLSAANARTTTRATASNVPAKQIEEEQPEAEELIPVKGIVDVLDSYAFVRTSGYLPGANDVYVSMGQVKKYGLRKGDAIEGAIRAPRDSDRRNQRQKFLPLQTVEAINGMSVEEARLRPTFSKLTPLYPQERLRMETEPKKLTGRLIDVVAPIGKGQRGLIVSPPKAGKTVTLQQIANSISTNNPEVHLMVVLVDERPEEVTDMERTVKGEVISSTFDRPASDHTMVAELAIERAKRLVELGDDVVVLLDSMTRLARAYNIATPTSGRVLSGGVDAQALYPPKKFFGAARNIENGGSLTIISSALVETGSKMDEVIFEEFKGTGNMELRLSRDLADKRLFPAIDINSSGTRREELITPPSELSVIYRLRRAIGGLEPEQAYQALVPRIKKTPTNKEFFANMASSLQSQQTQNNA